MILIWKFNWLPVRPKWDLYQMQTMQSNRIQDDDNVKAWEHFFFLTKQSKWGISYLNITNHSFCHFCYMDKTEKTTWGKLINTPLNWLLWKWILQWTLKVDTSLRETGGTQLDFFLIKLVTKFSRRWQTLRQPAINLWVSEDPELSNIALTLFAVIRMAFGFKSLYKL